MENLKIDENGRNVMGGLTNDTNLYIKNLRVNPVTGALLCEADILSSGTSIGSTIPGGTEGSILFLGPGSTLAEDNANLFFDDTNNRVGILTNAPQQTLDIAHKFLVNSGGNILKINNVATSWPALQGGVNTYLKNDGAGNLSWDAVVSSSGYTTIENQGVAVTQRSTINLSNLLVATDNAGKTDLTIDVFELANDATFVTDLIANTTFTTNLAGDTNFTTTLANNTNFINTLTSNSTFITNLSNNTTLTASATSYLVNQVAHGFAVGDVIRNNGTANTYTKAQADSLSNSNAVGIVSEVVDVDNFKFISEGIINAGVPVATAGTLYYLSPSSAGALTATEPSGATQFSKPMLTVLQSGARGYVHNSRGSIIAQPVAKGGTGAITLTGVLVGNGTSAITGTTVVQGDLIYAVGANSISALNKDTNATRYLANTGIGNNPKWDTINLSNGVSSQLPLANGGTGANLSDPGANKLWGWDDTDNAINFWVIGSGLSYDHATHTISSIGNNSKLQINTTNVTVTNDTTETTVFSVSIPANTLGTSNGIRVKGIISNLQTANASNTVTLRLKYGSTTIATQALTDNNFTPTIGRFEAFLLGSGATNTQEGYIESELKATASNDNTKNMRIDIGTGAEDSTTTLNLVMTVQWTQSGGGQTITIANTVIDLIS